MPKVWSGAEEFSMRFLSHVRTVYPPNSANGTEPRSRPARAVAPLRLLGQQTLQFGHDLFETATVGGTLLKENACELRRGFHLRLGVLLEFQINHLFDQFDDNFSLHRYLRGEDSRSRARRESSTHSHRETPLLSRHEL